LPEVNSCSSGANSLDAASCTTPDAWKYAIIAMRPPRMTGNSCLIRVSKGMVDAGLKREPCQRSTNKNAAYTPHGRYGTTGCRVKLASRTKHQADGLPIWQRS